MNTSYSVYISGSVSFLLLVYSMHSISLNSYTHHNLSNAVKQDRNVDALKIINHVLVITWQLDILSLLNLPADL